MSYIQKEECKRCKKEFDSEYFDRICGGGNILYCEECSSIIIKEKKEQWSTEHFPHKTINEIIDYLYVISHKDDIDDLKY